MEDVQKTFLIKKIENKNVMYLNILKKNQLKVNANKLINSTTISNYNTDFFIFHYFCHMKN